MLDDLDPTAPIFFVSYPRVQAPQSSSEPGEMRAHVTKFFEDLSANVNELLPLSTGQHPGFLDGKMLGGELWEREILEAVGRCQVLVPLLSPRFMRSAWCRFEWETFRSRTVRPRAGAGAPAASGAQAAIVPMAWTAMDPRDFPPMIAPVQGFTPLPCERHVAEAYQAEGLLGLRRMGLKREYDVVVWRLAQRIAKIVNGYAVEPFVPADASGVRRTFMEDDS